MAEQFQTCPDRSEHPAPVRADDTAFGAEPCRLRRALCLGSIFALAGCSTISQKPGTARVKIIADADINPTPLGQPAPTLVRIYTLRNDTTFMQADYLSLADQAAATLGQDLIDQREYVMVPGGKQSFSVTLSEEAGFFGILAGFREIETARWRAVCELEPHSENMVEIELSGLVIVVRSALYKAYGWW